MAVQTPDLEGHKLVDAVAVASGLPEEVASEALGQILTQYGQKSDSLTLDELRAVMLQYLEEINEDVVSNQE